VARYGEKEMAPLDNGFAKRALNIGETEVTVQSHRVGTRWTAKIETVDVGNSIGRGSGSSREEAETSAIESAKLVLDMRSAAAAFATSASRLKA